MHLIGIHVMVKVPLFAFVVNRPAERDGFIPSCFRIIFLIFFLIFGLTKYGKERNLHTLEEG